MGTGTSRTARITKITAAAIAVMLMAIAVMAGWVPQQAKAANIWALYKDGQAAQAKGDCATAIKKYTGMLPQLTKDKSYGNVANIQKRIGDCHAALKQYDQAVAAWDQESANWNKAGKAQETAASKRRADMLRSTVKLFIKEDAKAAAGQYYHGAKFEPKMGAYIGAYAELDQKVHDTKNWKYFYTEKFPDLTGRKHAAYLLYTTWGKPFDTLANHVKHAKNHGTALQIALQPMGGLDEVTDNEYIRTFAKQAGESGIPIFLRFANEMNGNWVPWNGDPAKYIEKFGLVADIFHEEASDNVVMVWAPNDIPTNTIEQYYPGDKYVDWIGVSLYSIYNPTLDPLKAGIDRSNHLQKFEHIYELYAKKKPLFISEGGIAFIYPEANRNVEKWAAYRTNEFYATLPMLYPAVKGVFWFDASKKIAGEREKHFMLSDNAALLQAYRQSVKHPFYLDTIGQESSVAYINASEKGIPARKAELSAYVKTLEPMLEKVEYYIGVKPIGSSKAAPWTIEHDFSSHKGKTVTITVKAFGPGGKLVTKQELKVNVK
ncbi:glycosyl hydrolase [Paenibacillus alkalitolerans]|uniref:glycosyl hydrolase n=1 Tax=Paenibacillus alkalitolerans TaxID=2799335 RepID=UPI0018F417E1|nr:glycosyl hydrolase [Paenibacillus alkalitolerans]